MGQLIPVSSLNNTNSPAQAEHYTAYKPRPFKRGERDKVTILYGGLTWKHERIVQGTFHNLKYKAEPLPNIARDDLDAGKELIDVGACCPTIFTTGSLVNLLKKKVSEQGKEAVTDNFVFLTAGACGPCRFGQYHESYAMALDGLGLRDFRLFLLAQDELDQQSADGGGLEINLPLSLGLVWAILCADLLTDLEYMTRPYEVNPGQTERVLKESVEYLYGAFRNRPDRGKKYGTVAWHLLTDYFTSALREVRRKWAIIEVDHLRVKAKVKITGEFWLQTHEGDGNYNIKYWLEQEDSEVVPPPVAVWLHYLLHPTIRRLDHGQTPQLRTFGLGSGRANLSWHLQPLPEGARQPPQRVARSGRIAALGGALLSLRIARRRRAHVDRESASCLSTQESAHDLRAFSLFLHAKHHVCGFHGQCAREISGFALRSHRSEGGFGSPCAFPVSDDSHRGEAAGQDGVQRSLGEDWLDDRNHPEIRGASSGVAARHVSRTARPLRGRCGKLRGASGER